MTIIKTIVQVIIVLGFLGGSFLILDDWQIAITIDILLILVIGQLLFLVSKLSINKNKDPIDPKRVASLIETENDAKPNKKKAQPIKKGDLTEDSKDKMDSKLFSKTQKNLKQSQKDGEEVTDRGIDDQDVVLPVSFKAKSKKQVAPARQDKIPAESPDSIFGDIQEPVKPVSTEIKPKKRIKPETISKKLSKISKSVKDDEKAPLISHETLTSKDLGSDNELLEDEAAIMYSVAEKAYHDGKYKEALNTTLNWFQNHYKYNTRAAQNKDLLKLKADSQFALLKYDLATATYQEYFKKYLRSCDDEYLAFLDDVTNKFSLSIQQHHAIQFYYTALNEYRQAGNHSKMDQLYNEIELAYRKTEDWPRLIQTFQNHLCIKKMLKDYDGQLTILDHLGKLQYDQGDANGSKKSYEQSIAIKKR